MEKIAFEYIGDRESIFALWLALKDSWRHVVIYDLEGSKQRPEEGINGLMSYQV